MKRTPLKQKLESERMKTTQLLKILDLYDRLTIIPNPENLDVITEIREATEMFRMRKV